MRRLIPLVALCPNLAVAEVPTVVTDIAPVHSLVAQVMGELGTPENLIDPTLSPHDFQLKPSQARLLQEARLLIMVGHELTPWLADRAEGMMAEGAILELLEASPTLIEPGHEGHDYGEHAEEGHEDEHSDHGEYHAEHDHDAEHGEHEHAEAHAEEDHEDHAEHGHDEHAEHDHDDHSDHGDEESHEGHDHGEEHAEEASETGHEGHNHAIDPHAWLNLDNANAWVGQIATALSELDPENAETYQANAAAAQAELQALDSRAYDKVSPVRHEPFLVYHNAYTYFTSYFGLVASGALASNEGAAPSAADVLSARETIEHDNVACFFTEPQFGPDIVETVIEGFDVKVGQLDPLGVQLELGPELYGQLIENLSDAFNQCLTSGT